MNIMVDMRNLRCGIMRMYVMRNFVMMVVGLKLNFEILSFVLDFVSMLMLVKKMMLIDIVIGKNDGLMLLFDGNWFVKKMMMIENRMKKIDSGFE